MRLVPLAAAFAAALLMPAAALADTFTFTPTGGTATTFTTGSTPDLPNTTFPYDSAEYFTDFGFVTFFSAAEGLYFDQNYGYGPTPFDLEVSLNGVDYLLDGVQLFTGHGDAPVFIPGTYTLTADLKSPTASGGTLVIGPAAVGTTPEPSSLILLGTGMAALAGVARRRFRTS